MHTCTHTYWYEPDYAQNFTYYMYAAQNISLHNYACANIHVYK